MIAEIRAMPASANRDSLLQSISEATGEQQIGARRGDALPLGVHPVGGEAEASRAAPRSVVWTLESPREGEVDLLLRALSTPGLVLDGISLRGANLNFAVFADALKGSVGLRELRCASL